MDCFKIEVSNWLNLMFLILKKSVLLHFENVLKSIH